MPNPPGILYSLAGCVDDQSAQQLQENVHLLADPSWRLSQAPAAYPLGASLHNGVMLQRVVRSMELLFCKHRVTHTVIDIDIQRYKGAFTVCLEQTGVLTTEQGGIEPFPNRPAGES